MKKYFLMIFIVVMLASSAYAKCDGGTEVTTSSGTFCKSNVDMPNWWAAAAWCKANDSRLATMYEMCPDWDGNTGNGKCSELSEKGSKYVYSSTAHGSESVFLVRLSDGSVYGGYGYYRHGALGAYAFCR